MATYTSADGLRCHIYTFKDGMLSAIAHDLRICVDRAEITVSAAENGAVIEGFFDPCSLRVECAQQQGRDAPRALSDNDKAKIAKNIQKDVLHTAQHREVRFRSTEVHRTDAEASITGELSLHGQTRTVQATAHRREGCWHVEVPLHQPDFGITPYSAMLGTLKVQPTVRVVISVPDESSPDESSPDEY